MRAVAVAVLAALAQEPLSDAEFERLHRELRPPEGELWRTIPWKASILEASREGAREKKPVLMRSRAGHPLGCV